MRSLLYIGILLCGFSCARNAPCLHPGDLLFQVGETSEMTGAITAATGKERQLNYSHVGIAVRSRGGRFGTGGHERRRRAGHGHGRFSGTVRRIDRTAAVTVMRLRDTTGVAAAIERARKIHRTALRLLVPTGQRQDVLQRTGMGKLPRPGRQQTISGPADEFPRGRRIVTPFWQNCLPDWERRFPRIFPERIPTTWHAIRNSKRSPAAIDMALPKRAAR